MKTAPSLPPAARFFPFYLAALLLTAGVALAMSGVPAVTAWPLAIGVFVLLVSSELGESSMPGGGSISLGGALGPASVFLLGPVPTAWLGLAAAVIGQGLFQRRPAERVAHDAAASAVTALAAGAVFQWAGGDPGSLVLPRDLWGLLAGGAVYFVVNSTLTATGIGLGTGPDPWRVWQRIFGAGTLYHVSFLALGGLLAAVYSTLGAWGVLLLALPLWAARRSLQLYVELRGDLKAFVRALSEILEEVDPYTRQHSVRVAQYAVRLARAMGLSEREIDDLEYAALVHDLGKIGPHNQHLLHKPGVLSHEEQRTLRHHPLAGAAIVSRVRALQRASEIVRYHHERPDGRGYPHGVNAREVPVAARILNVADAFDAMTSDRPYRRALVLDDAMRELRFGSGTQFDDDVVGCLMRLHDDRRFPLIPSPSSEELRKLRPRLSPAAS